MIKGFLYPIFTSRPLIFTVIWLPLKVANSKREKQLQNDIKGVDLSHRVFKGPPNALMGYPNGLRAPLPHLISKQPIFISQHLIFTVFGAYFVSKVANSKREKWDKNDKKRLEIAKSILFYIHKHCTTSFTSKQPILQAYNSFLQANSPFSQF